MPRLRDILNPLKRPGYFLPHLAGAGVVKLLFVLLPIVGGVLIAKPVIRHFGPHVHVLRQHLTASQVDFLNSVKLEAAPTGYVPPASLFRLTKVWAVIESYYGDEYSLLHSTPVQDTDYMVPAGKHERLTLPGPAWIHYTYLWTNYIQGSGFYMCFQAPNGGRFCYLHVDSPKGFHASARLSGGAYVGTSGWPTSYRYSNNSCNSYVECARDAHMCLITDALGADWMHTLVFNPPRKPNTFPLQAWQKFGKFSYKHDGKLMRIPRYWWKHHAQHARCGSPTGQQQWNRKARFMHQPFRRGHAYLWNLAKGQPVKLACPAQKR